MKTESSSWSVNKEKCLKCGACVAVCPVGALELVNFPENDLAKCKLCKTCEKVCPVRAIRVEG